MFNSEKKKKKKKKKKKRAPGPLRRKLQKRVLRQIQVRRSLDIVLVVPEITHFLHFFHRFLHFFHRFLYIKSYFGPHQIWIL
jgi:hypothetical protein